MRRKKVEWRHLRHIMDHPEQGVEEEIVAVICEEEEVTIRIAIENTLPLAEDIEKIEARGMRLTNISRKSLFHSFF